MNDDVNDWRGTPVSARRSAAYRAVYVGAMVVGHVLTKIGASASDWVWPRMRRTDRGLVNDAYRWLHGDSERRPW